MKLDFLNKLEAVDVIAIVFMSICGSLIALGYNSSVTAILLVISAYYFGHKRILNEEPSTKR